LDVDGGRAVLDGLVNGPPRAFEVADDGFAGDAWAEALATICRLAELIQMSILTVF